MPRPALLLPGFLLGLASALWWSSCTDDAPDDPLRVRTAAGVVAGFRDGGVRRHLGVPFAAPPVGDLRWRPPQPHPTWDSARAAKAFAHAPMSHNVWGDMRYRSPGFSEDCLYLNIWSPDADADTLRPVLVYFYGGGFVAGDASETRYDGAALAREGLVVVAPNYRLNVFGFLAHPGLSAEADYGGSGNYGLLDQVAALEWVRDNIEAFGGDPTRVTIAGESAGSWSVSAHCGSPLSQDLFAAAIGQSGGAVTPFTHAATLAEAEQQGLATAAALADPVDVGPPNASIEALRQLPADTLYARYRRAGLPLARILVDGYFWTRTLEEAYAAGEVARVPLLVGWTSAEGGDGRDLLEEDDPGAAFAKTVRERFPDEAEAVLAAYAHDGSDEGLARAAADYRADQFIVQGAWLWSRLHAEVTGAPVYRYSFAQDRPGGEGYGAPHASDIPYATGSLDVHADYPYGDAHHATARAMMRYVANFVKRGHPNGGGLPAWPPTDGSAAPPEMVFDGGATLRRAADARHVALRGLTLDD